MKGIFMFDHLNDLIFSKIDDNLKKHLHRLAVQDQLIKEGSESSSIDKDVIVQVFSPLLASYKVMLDQFGQTYQSLEINDGTLIVFRKILNYTVMHITHSKTDICHVQKEISMFLTLANMFYGPSLYLMDTSHSLKNQREKFLSQVLDEWVVLQNDSQMFLVEAVERLIVNPDIASLCIKLLQEVLENARSNTTEGVFSHAFLLVDFKLLAFYSSRNSGSLPKKCILLIIILVKAMLSSKQSSNQSILRQSPQTKEKGNSNSQRNQHNFFALLPSAQDDLVPYIIYTLKISSKINLVFLCELIKNTSLSKHLVFLINNLDILIHNSKNRPALCSFPALEKSFQNIVSSLEKLKDLEYNFYLKSLLTKWEQMKQFKLIDVFKNKRINSRLESSVQSVMELCKAIFAEIIILPALKLEDSVDYRCNFNDIRKISSKCLRDCNSYLEAKAEQNITMAPYISEFPGLIHFIYVDRNTNCLIAPAIVSNESYLKGLTSLKNKVWKMVKFGRKYVNGGNSYLCTWQHDDLKYFYSIWFENSDGKIMKPLQQVQNLPDKDILCGNFFRELIEKSFPGASYNHIYCYELFCIHLLTVNSSDVVEQSKQLSSRLWAFSGAHRVLDLL